ncbi:hypothetical protein B0T19DRAFT_470475, partial [Cercophora scortea]
CLLIEPELWRELSPEQWKKTLRTSPSTRRLPATFFASTLSLWTTLLKPSGSGLRNRRCRDSTLIGTATQNEWKNLTN